MNINFLIKKKHIFKKRIHHSPQTKLFFNLYYGLYSIRKFRFEFVYFKTFKKLFRKKYFKRKNALLKTKFWLMVKPNFLLTMKSKNSRMGSGVGSYVRVCSNIKPNKPVILFKQYPIYFVFNVVKYLKMKLNINFLFNFLKIKVKIV